ncbi:MAG TPA: HAD-IA family hydrolase [Tepidisphaeraceae bacterium]|jgi:FMN phosphatase YigB (HAD superfamily)
MTAPPSPIQLVVFDLGRVLVRICRDWQQACECAGIRSFNREVSEADASRLSKIAHRYDVGGLRAADFTREAASLMGLSPEQVLAMSDAFIFGPYPGATDLLAELGDAGVATACLSNTNEHHWGLLFDRGHRAWLPMDRFKHQFASHLVRARKPDEAIYAHVERATNLWGSAILFFDDVTENLETARKRGWVGEWIDPAPDEPIGQIRSALRRHRVQ